ncbi:hypothetical protein F5J12DRAFT_841209 [Pisolithus orientalis]|uniref:uncharacterized protein n=1 Tax=Pisolithus orientalis TaxID=936130 RepID=UPI002224B3B3|nr:uncharacterized protein F5J12DRAFT_884966 [Pisolithus orientalis]XP_051598668.1 uncharacterized protein F5J12DRAFT_841209 [Pisolithus orientalis]KAI5980467.1 hypothetical protein F5J12DRAFT_884966 [Pisolithus orientalis]KAI6002465.1 hypothetical protein F5J12DRAFT_841209 [Pisolithus orientalis]
MRSSSLLILLLGLVHITFATDLLGFVQWNDVCPSYEELGAAKILLDAGRYSAGVTRSGNFSIPDVNPGVYVLSVLSHDYTFEQFRVDVSDASSIPEVKSYVFGTPLLSPSAVILPYPIILSPRSKNSYFKPHESFSLLGMFRNPMMMLMLFTAGMMLAMPYIMKNLDPQSLEEIKNRREMVASIQNSVQGGDLKSGLSALLAVEDKTKASTSGAKVQPNNSGTTIQQRKVGKGGKRR